MRIIDLKNFDKSKFTNQPYVKRVEKPWGYEIIFSQENLPYVGKILHINAGKRLSLQYHDEKQETQFLVSGRCLRICDNQNGELVEFEMEKDKGYNICVGQRHRLKAIEDCDVFEVSTPETGNTYRLEDDYSRPTETEGIRKKPNRGWKGDKNA